MSITYCYTAWLAYALKKVFKLKTPGLVSVIITSYNWSSALFLVLKALDAQTDRHFEVLIADDGSSIEEVNKIRQNLLHCSFRARFIWQADKGFRAAKARNKAVSQAEGDYLVFLDGDCVPRCCFVAQHRRWAEPGFWVAGHRVLLSKQLTHVLLAKGGLLEAKVFYWWKQRLLGNINRMVPLFNWPFSWGRKFCKTSWKSAKTCNLGVWKKDFLTVNGFDESYSGWGYEDSDLVWRLIQISVCRKSGKFSLPVWHLWHPENSRNQEMCNLRRFQSMMAQNKKYALLGVDQYLS